LDACFQLLLSTLPPADQDLYLPIAVDQLTLFASPASETAFWGYAAQKSLDSLVSGDVYLFNPNGDLLMQVQGLRMQRMDRRGTALENRLYDIQWIPSDSQPKMSATLGDWLVLADETGIGEALAADLASAGAKVSVAYARESFTQDEQSFG